MKKSKTRLDIFLKNTFNFCQNHRLEVALFVVISILFWGLRLNNFDNMVTFHIDQGEHILETKAMIDEGKPRLIGPIVSTRIRDGRGYFIGPHYYYILATVGTLTGWSILGMTKALLFMWWGAILALVYWVGKKLSWTTAMTIYLLLATHPYLISYSRMFLNPNFTFPVAVGFFFFLWRAWQKKHWPNWLIAGIWAGVGFSFHFVVGIWLVIIGATWLVGLIFRRTKWWYLPIAAFGAVLGNLPYVVFELRHNFYNLRTFLSIGAAPEGSGLTAGYYLFAYIPVIIWLLAWGFERLKHRWSYLIPLIIALVFITHAHVTYDQPKVRGVGMPKGWSVPLQMELAQRICDDPDKGSFEIAAMVTADLRALDWRWFVHQCGAKPAGYGEYPFVDTLYLVDQGFYAKGELPGNWEIASMEPHRLVYQEQLNEFLWFYKLERIRPEGTPSQ